MCQKVWSISNLLFRTSEFPQYALVCIFSQVHNWQLPRPGVYGSTVRIIVHSILGFGFKSFSHTKADRVVKFLFSEKFLNSFLCSIFKFISLFFVNINLTVSFGIFMIFTKYFKLAVLFSSYYLDLKLPPTLSLTFYFQFLFPKFHFLFSFSSVSILSHFISL